MTGRSRGIVGRITLGLVLLGVTASFASAASRKPPVPGAEDMFTLVAEVSLGASTNRVDYQSIDPVAGRLYIAKMGAGELLAVDLGSGQVAAALKGFPKVTGVLAVPELHRIYASVPGAGLGSSISVALGMAGLSSGSGAIAILDSGDLHEVARVPGGVFPDGIAYDPKEQRVFVSDEMGATALIIDAKHDRLLGRIDAGGEVGNVRYDPITARIYAPIQSKNLLAVIDPAEGRIVARYPLAGADHPHGLMIAPDKAIGYVACDGNDQLLTVDLATGAILDRKPLGHDPDVLAIDPGLGRLYVAAESGILSSFDITAAAAPVALGNIFIADDAHSVAVEPVSHRLYFPLADSHGQAVLRIFSPKRTD
jgi:DNA-binding beta-propeller fold protein YncE